MAVISQTVYLLLQTALI